jgi:biuret amidohydrolase
MAWQRKDRVEDVVSPFLRESPGFEIVPELAPSASEAVFDKLSLSAFEGSPLEFALRRTGRRLCDRRRRDRGRGRAHRSARRRPRPHPVVVTDACGAGDHAAAKRCLDVLATAGDAILTDVATITGLLARPTVRQRGQSGPEAAAEDASR